MELREGRSGSHSDRIVDLPLPLVERVCAREDGDCVPTAVGGSTTPASLRNAPPNEPGFPAKAKLAARYEERSGRELGALAWFEALALYKAAVFCEAIYGR